ncbi:MAG: hypothetical protein QGI83_22085 [Candidatus Latescibacteria bacterium]|nr:hypothetical protein [Candidatus Latescibacterota bacterium]
MRPRRGTALAVHGVGGTFGNVLVPSITGVILTWLTWRGVLSIYAAAGVVLLLAPLRDIGAASEPE